MKNILVAASMPRLGFTENFQSTMYFAALGIPVAYSTGAYWQKSLHKVFTAACSLGYDWVLTVDYDSIFKPDDVKKMVSWSHQLSPTSCSVVLGDMAGREKLGSLLSHVEEGYGHFGFTLISTTLLEKISEDWIFGAPGKDPDILLWEKFKEAEAVIYVDDTLKIGHLEQRIKWPDGSFTGLEEFYDE